METQTIKELINKLENAKTSDKLQIESTKETPEITLDKEKGFIKFSGRSLPENAKEFYNPIKEWLTSYAEQPSAGTKVVFEFEYFNTASSKMIWECIEEVSKLQETDPDSVIEWHYLEDDDDMLEAGEDYAEMIGVDFKFVSYE